MSMLNKRAGIHPLPCDAGREACGGGLVDIAWENGKDTNDRITSQDPQTVEVRVNGEIKEIEAEAI